MESAAGGDFEPRLRAPRIAVLGPVAIGEPGQLRVVRGRPGRLLAALSAAHQPLDTEALSEAVWGEQLPSTYRSALHVHLSALRRMLADTPDGCRIARVGDGYVLERGRCEVDAELAIDLLTAARGALPTGPDTALDLVEQALTLWRGEPFSVGGDIVDLSVWHRLEAARREADELAIEALLATGQEDKAEVAAREAVDVEPLRERRWGQLLRARYLAGRTADALATFQEARAALVDALGIEPGQELRDLEAAVLTHDVSHLRNPTAPTTTFPGPPPPNGDFVDREMELRRVCAALVEGRPVTLLGPAGVGKSRLVAEALRQLHRERVAWIDVRDGTPATGAVIEWLRQFPDAAVVLDNAEAAPGAAGEITDAVRRSSPTAAVVVTSRIPIAAATVVETLAALQVPAAGATDEEVEATAAGQLLRGALRELAPTSTLSSATVAVLCRRAGGLPLVLRLSAAAARALPADALLALPASVEGDEIDRATRAVIDVLPDDAKAAFIDLAIVDGDFDAVLGARIASRAADRFSTLIVTLVDHGLVQAGTDRVHPHRIPEPIRTAGLRLLDESGRRPEVVDRYLDVCLEQARAIQGLAVAGEVRDLAERLRADLPRFRHAVEHLARIGDAERALRLVCWLDAALYVVGWWEEKTELFEAALRIDGPPTPMRARAHLFRSRPGPLHLIDVTHAERAEAIADELSEKALVAYARLFRSLEAWWSGRTGEAIDLAEWAAEVFAAEGKTFECCEARKFLGVATVLDGDPVKGLQIQRDALAVVRRELRNPFHIAHNLSYLGHCHRYLGDDTAALADWTEARELCLEVGNRGTAIHVNIGLADLAVDRGEPETALSRVAEALELIGVSGAWTYTSWAWTVAMRAHTAAGDVPSALACARSAVDWLDRVPPGEAVRLALELLQVALAAGEPVSAARLLGVASATPDRREMPFAPPAERARRAAAEAEVGHLLGPSAADHIEAGRRCTIIEAAGNLLAPPG